MRMIKALLACYIVTGIFLVVLSFLLYKWNLTEQIVTAGIVLVYALSTFVGGFIVGKINQVRKVQWGMLIGITYYFCLLTISYCLYHKLDASGTEILSTLFLCLGGAMLGARLS